MPRRPRRRLRREPRRGTHHAFSDRGEGYCVLNDSAIAARAVQAAGLVERVVIIDTDVHQGNGTAAILRGDPTVRSRSTAQRTSPSKRGERPRRATPRRRRRHGVPRRSKEPQVALDAVDASLAIYLGGADPFEGDRLGRLSVSKSGLAERDRSFSKPAGARNPGRSYDGWRLRQRGREHCGRTLPEHPQGG